MFEWCSVQVQLLQRHHHCILATWSRLRQQGQQWMVEFSSWLVSSTTFVENQLTNWKPTNFAISTVILQYNKVDVNNSCLKRLRVKLFPSKSVTVSLWRNHGPQVVCIDINLFLQIKPSGISMGWVDETSGCVDNHQGAFRDEVVVDKIQVWSTDLISIPRSYPWKFPRSHHILSNCFLFSWGIRSANGQLLVWVVGLGFESGSPLVTLPFIGGSNRNPHHRAPNQQLTISWSGYDLRIEDWGQL